MDGVQVETLQRLTRVETKLDGIEGKLDAAIDAKETAVKAKASADSAHLRLNKIDKIIFWLGTTIVGAVILAIIKFTTEGRN